jgi:uncharacterized membrane protein YjjB (DUF3815 family)
MVFEIQIIEKLIWSGVAGAGFAFIFNVPRRIILSVFIIAAITGFIKFVAILNGAGIIFSSLYSASFVGFVSIPIAKYKHTSPFVISIPSIISLIPGYFGYKTLLGIMRIALVNNLTDEISTILMIIHNALNMMFILGSLAIGVSLPWLLFREKGLRKMKITDGSNLV